MQRVGNHVVGELRLLVEARRADLWPRRLEQPAINDDPARQLAHAMALADLAQHHPQRAPVEVGIPAALEHQRPLQAAVADLARGQQLRLPAAVRPEPVQRDHRGDGLHRRGRRHRPVRVHPPSALRRVHREGHDGQRGGRHAGLPERLLHGRGGVSRRLAQPVAASAALRRTRAEIDRMRGDCIVPAPLHSHRLYARDKHSSGRMQQMSDVPRTGPEPRA